MGEKLQNEVLVAIMNNLHDFSIVQEKHWYRIPVSSVEKWLKNRWPPCWIAFYMTKVFGKEAYAINYYGKILKIKKVYRWQLFPDEPANAKSRRRYYQIFLEQPLERLPKPILSRRYRRIVFISTTLEKFVKAVEINDLFDASPLEDRLWAEFKRLQINAERQEFVKIEHKHYALDFAIYCQAGKIDVETDGDYWHANPQQAAKDNVRDNDLKTEGWRVLRFNTLQVKESAAEYCTRTIVKNINRLGGLQDGKSARRKINLKESGFVQLNLFDM
jgi:very-short-patch-repair endonuclease